MSSTVVRHINRIALALGMVIGISAAALLATGTFSPSNPSSAVSAAVNSPSPHACSPSEADACCPDTHGAVHTTTENGAGEKEEDTNASDVAEEEMCLEHRVPESRCAVCRYTTLTALHPGQGLWIRLRSSLTTDALGLRSESPEPIAVSSGVTPRYSGQVQAPPDHIATVSAPMEGSIQQIRAVEGQQVRRGDVIALLDAPEVAGLRAEYAVVQTAQHTAQKQYEREAHLHQRGITSAKDLEEAQRTLREAQARGQEIVARARSLGVDLTQDNPTTTLLSLTAPRSGVVLRRLVNEGARVVAGQELVVIADTSTVWFEAAVPSDALPSFQEDVAAWVTFPEWPDLSYRARWVSISPTLAPQSRHVLVHFALENHGGLLHIGMWGELYREEGSPQGTGLAVPGDATVPLSLPQQDQALIFIEKEPQLYEIRKVRVARRTPNKLFISEGISADERVVTAGIHTLYSELRSTELGGGCAD